MRAYILSTGDEVLLGDIVDTNSSFLCRSLKDLGIEVEKIIAVGDSVDTISENIKEKVFIPNFSTKDAGSGIGLAVAKRGIEHAGGEIWFESVFGKGTNFFIKLPLHLG